MSITPMDLDSSLDDLIKKRRKGNFNKKPQQQQQKSQGKNKQPTPSNSIKSRLSLQTKAKVNKPTQPQRPGINSRLSTSSSLSKSGPLFTFKNQSQQTKPVQRQKEQQQQGSRVNADPSQIIITKAIAPNSVQSRMSTNKTQHTNSNSIQRRDSSPPITSILHGRLGKQPSTERVETSIYSPSSLHTNTQAGVSNFTIRGLSNTISPTTGLSIKHKSGPTLILISGLDPGTSSDDLRLALEPYGYMLRCEVVRNREGRSYGEAEVEFSTKKAALDVIARLDNTMADGQFLRVVLRENNPPPKPMQSVISSSSSSSSSPSFVPSGKMYADQISSRYDIRRQ